MPRTQMRSSASARLAWLNGLSLLSHAVSAARVWGRGDVSLITPAATVINNKPPPTKAGCVSEDSTYDNNTTASFQLYRNCSTLLANFNSGDTNLNQREGAYT